VNADNAGRIGAIISVGEEARLPEDAFRPAGNGYGGEGTRSA